MTTVIISAMFLVAALLLLSPLLYAVGHRIGALGRRKGFAPHGAVLALHDGSSLARPATQPVTATARA